MLNRRIPEWLRHPPAPGVRGFALLSGFEAMARGILISVYPLAIYQALQDPVRVSEVYFAIGLISLASGLMVPWLNQIVPRRWLYALACGLYVLGAGLAAYDPRFVVAALAMNTVATVTLFVCTSAYVLDFIARADLGRCETLRMFYSALGWAIGPACGVLLMAWWRPAPFLIAGLASLAMLVAFLIMRLGNGRLITRARAPAPNPLAYLKRFAAQPRLIAGWLFAVIRSCGWWVYVVYLPIFAVENGLGEELGGIILSLTNASLFAAPLMLRWMQRRTVRASVRTGFAFSGLCFVVAWMISPWPPAALAALAAGSVFLVLLDICGGLPFLMAVKPSERTEMSAVYASYRDVSGVLTPGVAWLVLLAAPLAGVFVAAGTGLFAAWAIAGTLHPRLGTRRVRDLSALPDPQPVAVPIS